MNRRLTHLPLLIAMLLVAGCLWNNVHQIQRSSIEGPSGNRALVVLGIFDDQLGLSPPSVQLDEYDAALGQIVASCWRYNQIVAEPDERGPNPQYLVFSVKPGPFVVNEHRDSLVGAPNLFYAPSGSVVYVGEFHRVGSRKLTLQRDLDAASPAIARQFPNLPARLKLADSSAGPASGGMIACTP